MNYSVQANRCYASVSLQKTTWWTSQLPGALSVRNLNVPSNKSLTSDLRLGCGDWQNTHRNTRNRGVARKFVSEGDKRVGSVTSGVHTGTEPTVGSGAKPPNTKNMLKIWLNVTNSILFVEKFFSLAISEGDMSPLSPSLRRRPWLTCTHSLKQNCVVE